MHFKISNYKFLRGFFLALFFFSIVTLFEKNYTQNQVFFSTGPTLFITNFLKLLIFFYFIPVTIGASYFYSSVNNYFILGYESKNKLKQKNFNYNLLIGFSFLTILGFVLGTLKLLNFFLISILFSFFIFFFFHKNNLLKNFSSKTIILLFLLLIFFIYKYIYPETWSQDSISWYLNLTSNISFFKEDTFLLNESFYHNWFLLRGNGQPILWSVISDGDATRLVSVYCLFGSCFFMYDLVKKIFNNSYIGKKYNLIIFILSFLFLFSKVAAGEYQKFHYITLFFISGIYWFFVNYNKTIDFKLSSPIYLILISILLDKSYSAFFIMLIYVIILFISQKSLRQIFSKKLFFNIFRLLGILIIFISFIWYYNLSISGQLDGYMWKIMAFFRNDIVFSKYLDQDLIDLWLHNYYNVNPETGFKLFSNHISWLNFFDLPKLLPLFFLLFLFSFINKKIRLQIIKFDKSNRLFVVLVSSFVIYLFLIFLTSLVNVSIHKYSILRALIFGNFFGYLSFLLLILFYLNKFLSKKSIRNNKLNHYMFIFSIFILSLGLLFKFDRTSNFKAYLPDNVFFANKQISYFVGRSSVKDTVNKDRFNISLCEEIDELTPSKSKVLLLTNSGSDCRGVPTKKINLFQPNYKNLRLHLSSTPNESYKKLKEAGFTHFVFSYTNNDLKKTQPLDDFSFYYKAFDMNKIEERFSVYLKKKNLLILTLNKDNLGKKFQQQDLNLLKKLKQNINNQYGTVVESWLKTL